MSQEPAPPRQPGHVWDRKYQDFSKAQHVKAKAIGERVVSEPVTLSTLGEMVAAEIGQMVRDADAMADTRYKEIAAERDRLEAQLALYDETINKLTRDVGDRDMKLGEYQRAEIAADELQGKLKKAMTDKGIKLPS